MKIGIIGLRPRQYSDLRERQINGHELVFFEGQNYGQAQVAAFVRKVDHVVLLPGHVPKRLNDWILKDKLKTLAGGISTVLRYVEGMAPAEGHVKVEVSLAKQSPSHVEPEILASIREQAEPTAVPAVESKPLATFTPRPPAKPPQKMGQTIPKGRESQYEWTPNLDPIKPDSLGNHRYDILDAAVPGDMIRLARHKNIEFDVWRLRLTSMRYSREKSKGQFLEIHYYANYADVLVLNPDGTPLDKPHDIIAAADEAEGTVERLSDLHTAAATSTYTRALGHIEDEIAAAPQVKEEVSDAPTIQEYVAEAPRPPKVTIDYLPAKPVVPPEEKSFWREAYLIRLDQGDSTKEAAEGADESLAEYRKRFEA